MVLLFRVIRIETIFQRMLSENDDAPETFIDDIEIANNVVIEEDNVDVLSSSALVRDESCMHFFYFYLNA